MRKEEINYRYRIKELYSKLDNHHKNLLKKRILKATGISERTFGRYLNQKEGDTTDIPTTVLYHFAIGFQTSIEALFTKQESRPEMQPQTAINSNDNQPI